MHWATGLLLSVVLARAPLQCASEPEPALRRYETPEESLYALAERFREQGDEAARRTTLQHLVDRYPNSRFAVRARSELDEPGPGDAGATRVAAEP